MRLLDLRQDGPLAAGLVAGTVVVFQQPLRWLLDIASDVEHRYGLDLIPALVVLSVVFLFHTYRKRQEMNAAARTAAAQVAAERSRVEELEQLVTLGRGLANALDFTALRHAIWRHLPKFLRPRALWVVLRQRDQWHMVVEDTDTVDRTPASAIENIAALALARLRDDAVAGTSIVVDGYECFPMASGTSFNGMLVMRHAGEELSEGHRRGLDAAIAFLSIAIRNVQLLIETHEHSVKDSLTGWFNRGHGLSTLGAELQRSKRSGAPLSILMFDVDEFKTLNDRYGHQAGDAVLVATSRQVSDLLRASDLKCRYGGDEFFVILPDTPAGGAQQVAEHIRRTVASQPIPASGEVLSVTTSIGVATARTGELDTEALIARADVALYRAKREGRNRVAIDDGQSPEGPRLEPLRVVPLRTVAR
jgi:diguanylate cyclase (GGDEF)-like protein